MSWSDLRRIGITLRPFENPPGSGGVHSPFEASLGQTIELLGRELRALSAKQVVLQLGYREQDLRIDGMPRANAKMTHNAVAVSFESKWGPLRYETNEFLGRYYLGQEGWAANLRAIALGMEALRKVDRYGVSKRGEQYAGWRALPAGSDDEHGIPNAAAAREYLEQVFGGDMKRALMETHPDRGGDREEFGKVMRIKGLLDV